MSMVAFSSSTEIPPDRAPHHRGDLPILLDMLKMKDGLVACLSGPLAAARVLLCLLDTTVQVMKATIRFVSASVMHVSSLMFASYTLLATLSTFSSSSIDLNVFALA